MLQFERMNRVAWSAKQFEVVCRTLQKCNVTIKAVSGTLEFFPATPLM